jgi:[acyl-carrier-protein] S-malonyltransferase
MSAQTPEPGEPATESAGHDSDLAARTALLFPPGGAHWPGMGSDLDNGAHPEERQLMDRAEVALAGLGVPAGALRRLMCGEGQATRSLGPDGWQWHGDFPLSVAAQTVTGVALARAFARTCGAPGACAGESMGEIAAYCTAGALEIEDAVQLAHSWARSYQAASEALGLRMAVVEHLDVEQLATLGRELDGRVVVHESPHLNVFALPRARLAALELAVTSLGGRALVSNNPCAAHDPRLHEAPRPWADHQRLVETLRLRPPRLTLLSTLEPGRRLDSVAVLRDNLARASFTAVRWSETVLTLPALGVRRLLQVGLPSRPYALEKLQGETPQLEGLRIKSIRTVSVIERLARRRPTA